jgi:hypothetical protein
VFEFLGEVVGLTLEALGLGLVGDALVFRVLAKGLVHFVRKFKL